MEVGVNCVKWVVCSDRESSLRTSVEVCVCLASGVVFEATTVSTIVFEILKRKKHALLAWLHAKGRSYSCSVTYQKVLLQDWVWCVWMGVKCTNPLREDTRKQCQTPVWTSKGGLRVVIA